MKSRRKHERGRETSCNTVFFVQYVLFPWPPFIILFCFCFVFVSIFVFINLFFSLLIVFVSVMSLCLYLGLFNKPLHSLGPLPSCYLNLILSLICLCLDRCLISLCLSVCIWTCSTSRFIPLAPFPRVICILFCLCLSLSLSLPLS